MLAPVGIINERHEPPSFHGVERPFVDTFIIPTTWFDARRRRSRHVRRRLAVSRLPHGAARRHEITAEEGLGRGAPEGFQSNVRNIAQTARLEYGGFAGWCSARASGRARAASTSAAKMRVSASSNSTAATTPDRSRSAASSRSVYRRRRRRVERSAAAQHRREPEHRQPDARLLRRAVRAAAAGAALRLRGLRALRKLRHPVPHAGRRAAAEAVRSRRLGRRGVVFPGPRRRASRSTTRSIRNRSALFGSVDSLNIGLGWWF